MPDIVGGGTAFYNGTPTTTRSCLSARRLYTSFVLKGIVNTKNAIPNKYVFLLCGVPKFRYSESYAEKIQTVIVCQSKS